MAFLLPNLLGFCAFTLVPLALSFAMAFTDWDIMRHNQFRHEPLHFTGLENFIRLLGDPQFWRDLGNTFYLMLGLPFAMAGSLGAALLLTRVSRRRTAVLPALAAFCALPRRRRRISKKIQRVEDNPLHLSSPVVMAPPPFPTSPGPGSRQA